MTTRDVRWLQLFGWSHSGKTRVLTAVIRLLSADGRRVLAIKHSHHRCPEGDPTTASDTAAFLGAGAAAALLLTPDGACIHTRPSSTPKRLHAVPVATAVHDALETVRADWLVVEGGHDWGTPKVGMAGPTDLKPGAPPVLAILGPAGQPGLLRGPENPAGDPGAAALWILAHAHRVSARVKDLALHEALERGPAAAGAG